MILDTNVVSELRKGSQCHPAVRSWQEKQALNEQYLSVITLLELSLGIELASRKQPEFAARLASWYENRVKGTFGSRVLPVTTSIAETCARLHAERPRPYRDALIAATASVHRMPIATRNEKDFSGCGVSLENPWDFTK